MASSPRRMSVSDSGRRGSSEIVNIVRRFFFSLVKLIPSHHNNQHQSQDGQAVQMRHGRHRSTAGVRGPARRMSLLPSSEVLSLEVVVRGTGFKVQVNAERTVEQLAQHIEGVWSETNAGQAPFQCHVLTDEEGQALSFDDTVGETVATGAILVAESAVDEPRATEKKKKAALVIGVLITMHPQRPSPLRVRVCCSSLAATTTCGIRRR